MKKGEADLALSQTKSLDDQALDYLTKNGTTTVPALLDALRVKNSTLSDTEVADLVRRLAGQDLVAVEDVPLQVRSLMEYLGLWERNLWFYASVVLSLFTVPVIYALPAEFPLVAVRWILGSVFVLFLPGYVTVEALFPRFRELDAIERFALSIGLSLALVPLVGLLLNYTPWGVRLTPIVTSLTIFTLGIAGVGVGRRYRIDTEHWRSTH
ncbi:MAG: DUF1616 domain-containing protein [Candidatus Bathyarchaeia archaeon]